MQKRNLFDDLGEETTEEVSSEKEDLQEKVSSEKEDLQEEITLNNSDEELDLLKIMRDKKKKKNQPEHMRKTFYVKRNLAKEMDKFQRKFGYGFTTEFINVAIRNQLRLLQADKN